MPETDKNDRLDDLSWLYKDPSERIEVGSDRYYELVEQLKLQYPLNDESSTEINPPTIQTDTTLLAVDKIVGQKNSLYTPTMVMVWSSSRTSSWTVKADRLIDSLSDDEWDQEILNIFFGYQQGWKDDPLLLTTKSPSTGWETNVKEAMNHWIKTQREAYRCKQSQLEETFVRSKESLGKTVCCMNYLKWHIETVGKHNYDRYKFALSFNL